MSKASFNEVVTRAGFNDTTTKIGKDNLRVCLDELKTGFLECRDAAFVWPDSTPQVIKSQGGIEKRIKTLRLCVKRCFV